MRHSSMVVNRVGYRVVHALTGALAGALLAAAMLAIQSGASSIVVIVVSSAMLGSAGYLVGRVQDRLQASSLTDALTGLGNRRFFDQRLSSSLHMAHGCGFAVAVLLVDLDNLKDINDSCGHGAGDKALRTVAATMQRICRRTDAIARWGGDEFAIVALFATVDDARQLAARLRGALPHSLCFNDFHVELTVSIGIAGGCAPDGEEPSAEMLVCEADRALYRAKARGGNCIENC